MGTEEKLAQAEARILALMTLMAAVIKHHPDQVGVMQTIDALSELSACALLPRTHPDAAAETLLKTVEQVRQLAKAAP
jgi:hypothetical protein